MGVTVRDFEQFYIRKNHASGRPGRILYLDTETKTEKGDGITKHRMKMGWTCYYERRSTRKNNTEKWLYWEDPLSLQKYIESLTQEKTKLTIFAHNLFFDLQVSDFFYYFTKQGWSLDFFYDKGLVYILSIRKGKKAIKCLSTTNFFPVGLKALGKMIGLPKLDVDFKESTNEELKVYCKRDVEIIKAVMEYYWQFLDKHDLGNFTATKSSQAMAAFRHRFMDTKICVHRDEDMTALEKLAYYGGRVEAGQVGEVSDGPFVSLDVNSMYPFVMRLNQFPTRIIDYIENPADYQVKMILKERCLVAKVYLNTDEPAYAYRQGGKIIFPIGKFPTYLCTKGLEYAYHHNHLISVDSLVVYEKDYIFGSYVDYFYELKKQYSLDGNEIMKMLTKYFLNSLYGKFAQKKPLIEMEEDMTCDGYYREETLDLVTGQKEIITKLFNKTFIEWGSEIANNSFVAISAHVTEYARFYLYQIMKNIGLDNVLYVDTDSIKIRKSVLKNLSYKIDPIKLGALKLEEESEKLIIHGPKDYETENTTKIKGVPKSAKKKAEGVYTYTSFPRQDSHLRKQITRYFFTREVKKTLKREYTKGIVDKTGKVSPIVLDVPLRPSS